MLERPMPKASDEAAHKFYGQNDAEFALHIKQLTAADPRLAKIFEKTRERYLNGDFSRTQ